MAKTSIASILHDMYTRLWETYGPQHWWPAETPTEMVIGAILTQNTAWKNVERAMANLKTAHALDWRVLRDLPAARLAELIRPAGTYRVKAARLKALVNIVWREYGGSLDSLLEGEVEEVRQRLLAIPGIGPETADAILLYAGGRPTFVVDAYTQRILRRHQLVAGRANYETVQSLFHGGLKPDVRVYNEYHALLVAVGKKHCRNRACCRGCPLEPFPHDAEA